MSTDEKPLHVRVAEALGCKPQPFVSVGRGIDLTVPDAWACHCPGSNSGKAHGSILGVYRYDTDWAATGPLVERYKIGLVQFEDEAMAFWPSDLSCGGDPDCMWIDDQVDLSADGPTPLLAICNLILALHAAGKLKEAA